MGSGEFTRYAFDAQRDRQRQGSFRKLARLWKVQERGKEHTIFECSRRGQLRNRNSVTRRRRSNVALCNGAVCCAEIDADDAAHGSSTSAGATTRGSRASETSGTLTSVAIQP